MFRVCAGWVASILGESSAGKQVHQPLQRQTTCVLPRSRILKFSTLCNNLAKFSLSTNVHTTGHRGGT
ncbi:hypothetical protein LENED_005562 [Lentinula edodes]|uniref:Uncharacterized protein n=1 Tax=Lentinula edodes TaxID=5353 RepID=A0A1Q3E9B4_LENED|nr:hypothetical protein LENED_005562 [Lentinula edodes]